MEPKEGNRLLTAKLVGSYLRHHKVGASQLPDLIATVHRSLGELGQQPLPKKHSPLPSRFANLCVPIMWFASGLRRKLVQPACLCCESAILSAGIVA
jgi:hypothetical protein